MRTSELAAVTTKSGYHLQHRNLQLSEKTFAINNKPYKIIITRTRRNEYILNQISKKEMQYSVVVQLSTLYRVLEVNNRDHRKCSRTILTEQ